MKIDQETTAYAHLMLEHAPVAMALFDTQAFCLRAANPAFAVLLIPARQDGRAIGCSLRELLPREEYHRWHELFQRVVELGSPSRMKAYAFPTCRGEIKYWDWNLDPIVEQGQMKYVLLTITESTTQMQAPEIAKQADADLAQTQQELDLEQQRREHMKTILLNVHNFSDPADLIGERQRLHAVLNQLPEGIVLVEARTGKVRYANPIAAQLLGYALPELVGAPLNQSALLSPYGRSTQEQQSVFRWNFALIHALWGKVATNQEITIHRPDGSKIVALGSAAPIRASNGLITEAVMVLQDITTLKQLEQQKSEFFAIANHELRTPLTAILGFAELLQLFETEERDRKYHNAVTSIMYECERLLRLIHDLLDISRLEYARIDMKKNSQDILSFLAHIVTKYTQTINTHRLHLTLEDLEAIDLLMGWFDPIRIEQIVSNLITNAIKYSPADSEIELGVRPHRAPQGTGQEVVIWVKDQGIGIAPHDLPHIFERFYRAEGRDRSISGFGIGLYLTRELVRAHGGRIWVTSQKGQGSTFFVMLPLGETV